MNEQDIKLSYIYSLNCPITGEVKYIGKSKDPETRFKKHIRTSKKYPKTKKECWIKSLLNTNLIPILSIIEKCDVELVNSREIAWIKYYRGIGLDIKNLTDGGDGLTNPSLETRTKISNALIGNKLTAESRAKQIATAIITWSNPELREKQRIAGLGRKLSKENIAKAKKTRIANGGYIVTDAMKKKISNSLLGNIPWNKTEIMVIQLDKYNNQIKTWNNHHEASAFIGGEPKRILQCCNGVHKIHKKYKWKYYENI